MFAKPITSKSQDSDEVASFRLMRTSAGEAVARQWLLQRLSLATEAKVMAIVGSLAAQGATYERDAVWLLETLLPSMPDTPAPRFALGAHYSAAGDALKAEAHLKSALEREPGHHQSAYLLARVLRDQGRCGAACTVLTNLSNTSADHSAVKLHLDCAATIKQMRRHGEAKKICNRLIEAGVDDPNVEALLGELELSTGNFESARAHYERALGRGLDDGLLLSALTDTQRYGSAEHVDIARMRAALLSGELSADGEIATRFALGKVLDEIGELESAMLEWRAANAKLQQQATWSAQEWTRFVESRLLQTPAVAIPPPVECIPIFIVGLPRSGTTLVEQMLLRDARTVSRGETNLLEFVSGRLAKAPGDERALYDASRFLHAHLKQDDAGISYVIDKNPLNFLYLDLVSVLLPHARVIYCRRSRRDTALSIWSHHFASQQNAYACDLHEIARVMRDSERLMAHWQRSLALPMHEVQYEQLVDAPELEKRRLFEFLGMDAANTESARDPETVIGTSSVWQARQPIYRTAVGRASAYRPHFPELFSIIPP